MTATITAVLTICFAAAIVFFMGKKKNTIEEINASKKLTIFAYGPELLSVTLTIMWAWSVGNNPIVSFIVCVCFAAFVVLRAVSIPVAVSAIQARNYQIGSLMSLLALGSLIMLLSTSLFDLINKASIKASIANEKSKPMVEIDREIELTRDKIRDYAAFSLDSKAKEEITQIKREIEENKQKIMSLDSGINEMLSDVPVNSEGVSAGKSLYDITDNCRTRNWYYRNYCGKIESMREELYNIKNYKSTGSEYARKNSEYNSLMQHLETLQKRRESITIDGTYTAVSAEDRIIASVFGIDIDKAMALKWFIFAVCFDFLAMLARIGASMLDPDNKSQKIKDKINAYIKLGIDPFQNDTLKPAGVAKSNIPSLDTGGKITSDGLAFLHKGEIVLTKQQSETLEKQKNTNITHKNKILGEKRACGVCGKQFNVQSHNQIYCGKSCKKTARKERNNG